MWNLYAVFRMFTVFRMLYMYINTNKLNKSDIRLFLFNFIYIVLGYSIFGIFQIYKTAFIRNVVNYTILPFLIFVVVTVTFLEPKPPRPMEIMK